MRYECTKTCILIKVSWNRLPSRLVPYKPTAKSVVMGKFRPTQLRNRLTDIDEIRTLTLHPPPEDHPPCKISFGSDESVVSANTQFATVTFLCYGRPIGCVIIFCSCGFYLLFFFLLFFSPILSAPRLDLYHTCTHDVVLVQIWNASLKCAAHDSLKIRDAKVTQKIAICKPLHQFFGLYLRN